MKNQRLNTLLEPAFTGFTGSHNNNNNNKLPENIKAVLAETTVREWELLCKPP